MPVTAHPWPLLSALLALGCPPSQALDDSGEPAVACPSSWAAGEDGVWLQPHACLGWSPRSDEPMDWYAAASPESAVAGGCSAHCAEEPGWCDSLAGLGGIARWRLPSIEELQVAAETEPPLTPLDGYLWSRDTCAQMEDMAWQIELDNPLLQSAAGKDQDGWARCVADLAR
jgi:hypothetical protein